MTRTLTYERLSHPRRRVLLVDASVALRDQVEAYLTQRGFLVTSTRSRNALVPHDGDVAIVDIGARGDLGARLCLRLSTFLAARLIIIGEALDPIDIILCLEAGADDVLERPCSSRELVARINAVLRGSLWARSPTSARPLAIRFAGYTLELVERRLRSPDGLAIWLRPSLHVLLRVLLDHPGVVMSREMLAARIGAAGDALDPRVIDARVSRLRHQLSKIGGPMLIRTVRARGYLLCIEPVEQTRTLLEDTEQRERLGLQRVICRVSAWQPSRLGHQLAN